MELQHGFNLKKYTVESAYNDPVYNELPAITNKFLSFDWINIKSIGKSAFTTHPYNENSLKTNKIFSKITILCSVITKLIIKLLYKLLQDAVFITHCEFLLTHKGNYKK